MDTTKGADRRQFTLDGVPVKLAEFIAGRWLSTWERMTIAALKPGEVVHFDTWPESGHERALRRIT